MTQAPLAPPCLALSSRSGSRRVTKSRRAIHSAVRSLRSHNDFVLIGIPRIFSVLSAMKVTTFYFWVDVSLQVEFRWNLPLLLRCLDISRECLFTKVRYSVFCLGCVSMCFKATRSTRAILWSKLFTENTLFQTCMYNGRM